MENLENKRSQRQIVSSYFTTTLSITLVLFILGAIGLLALNVRQLSNYVKENIGLTVILKDDVREPEAKRLQKIIDISPFVKSTDYISKERASAELKKELGEDFETFLGSNPLPISINIKLKAIYAEPNNMETIKSSFSSFPEVREVYYQKDLMSAIHNNLRKITLLLGTFASVLLLITIALINNTIRLLVYSKRFLIRTMQLVGATKGFIRKPFLTKSIFHGFIGASFAIILLSLVIYTLQQELEGIIGFESLSEILSLFFIVIILGILITFVSTYFALNKYLKLRTEDLYY